MNDVRTSEYPVDDSTKDDADVVGLNRCRPIDDVLATMSDRPPCPGNACISFATYVIQILIFHKLGRFSEGLYRSKN